ncbi:SWIM zinc finger [Halogranum amylolyticum]|uniref:SWIM zinc finger n=2 Tax=Halogranum amylolyticum TaxID=660520 RepID=A0A1H8QTC6_9EURY|nr:SWIM zinc finger [Halogranum amylolyticum]
MVVRPLRDDRYVVETDHGTYVVDLDERSCTCPDHAIRGARCKHLRRVAIEVNEGRVPPPGKRSAVCAVCGVRTFVPIAERGPQLCDDHRFTPGEFARDRETGSVLVVTELTTERADEYETEEGRTVADYETNVHYGGHEPVVEAAYVESLRAVDGVVDLEGVRRYGFPASRLQRLGRSHPRVAAAPTTDAAPV